MEGSPSSKCPSIASKGSPYPGQNGNAMSPHSNTITLYDNHYSLTPHGDEDMEDYHDYHDYRTSMGPSPYHVRYGSHSPHPHPKYGSHTLQYVKVPPAYRIVTAGVRHLSGQKSQSATV